MDVRITDAEKKAPIPLSTDLGLLLIGKVCLVVCFFMRAANINKLAFKHLLTKFLFCRIFLNFVLHKIFLNVIFPLRI